MAHIFVSWLVLSFAVWLAAKLVPGFRLKGIGGAFLVAALFGVLNWLLGWVFFVLIGIATLGLGFLLAFATRWIVDAIVLEIVDAQTDQLEIRGFFSALAAAFVMSAAGTVAECVVRLL